MKFNLLLKVFLPLLVVFLFSGAIFSLTIFYQIRNNKIAEEKDVNYKFILNQTRYHLAKEYFLDPYYQGDETYFGEFTKEIGSDEIVDMKFWNKDSQVIYSGDRESIGKVFAGNEELREALSGKVVAEVKSRNELLKKYGGENYITAYGQLMELYVPITFKDDPGNVVGVVETYVNMNGVNKEIGQLVGTLILAMVSIMIILLITIFFVFQFFIISPVNKLGKVARKIISGQWGERVNIRSSDEIGYLAGIFNEMIGSIAKSQALTAEEADRMKAIISSMAEGLLVLDRDLSIMLLNKTAENALKVSLDKVRGRNITEVLTLMKGSKLLPLGEWPAKRMFRSGKPVRITMKDNYYYKTATGRLFPVEITTAPFVRSGIVGAIVIFRDISDIKTLEEDKEFARVNLENVLKSVYIERDAVRDQKNKLEAILNSIGDAVFVVDKQKKLLVFNSVAEKVTGFKSADLKGRSYSDHLKFVDEITKKEKSQFIDSALKGEGSAMANHTVLVTKDGNLIAIDQTTAPIRDSKGTVIGCVVVFRDVTAKREVERMRSDFISIASHQLRTPLSGIKWFLEILLNGDLGRIGKKQMEAIKEIHENNQNMIDIVNKMLNMSRIESNRLIVNPEKIKLNIVIQKIIESIKPVVEKKGQKLDLVGIKDARAEIVTDKILLENIINNLVVNASRYTPNKGKIRISITRKSKGILLFKISDNGIGIPKKEEYKIFHKFFRASNAILYEANGTGIGLYIVKSILEIIGGEIWFKTKENEGTTFFFTLPVDISYCKIK